MQLDNYLSQARRVCVLTGAGVSAESGIPTFRDAKSGFWASFDPADLATPEAFQRDPARVWSWYAMRRRMARSVEPNAAHRALAALEPRYESFTLVTQNVDDLHGRAGSRNVLEIHGNILRARCAGGCVTVHRDDRSDLAAAVFAADQSAAAGESHTGGQSDAAGASDAADDPDAAGEAVPTCPECGDYFRPDVVWFGETLPPELIDRAFTAAADCDLFLLIGTSAEVYPAAGLPGAALERGARVVEINPDPTAFSTRATLCIREPAAAYLSRFLEQSGS